MTFERLSIRMEFFLKYSMDLNKTIYFFKKLNYLFTIKNINLYRIQKIENISLKNETFTFEKFFCLKISINFS